MALEDVFSEMGRISVVQGKVLGVSAKGVIFTTSERGIARPGCSPKPAEDCKLAFILGKIGPGKVVRRKVAAGSSCKP